MPTQSLGELLDILKDTTTKIEWTTGKIASKEQELATAVGNIDRAIRLLQNQEKKLEEITDEEAKAKLTSDIDHNRKFVVYWTEKRDNVLSSLRLYREDLARRESRVERIRTALDKNADFIMESTGKSVAEVMAMHSHSAQAKADADKSHAEAVWTTVGSVVSRAVTKRLAEIRPVAHAGSVSLPDDD